jgi:hypothetical protein
MKKNPVFADKSRFRRRNLAFEVLKNGVESEGLNFDDKFCILLEMRRSSVAEQEFTRK